jgi:hypothetical protein
MVIFPVYATLLVTSTVFVPVVLYFIPPTVKDNANTPCTINTINKDIKVLFQMVTRLAFCLVVSTIWFILSD